MATLFSALAAILALGVGVVVCTALAHLAQTSGRISNPVRGLPRVPGRDRAAHPQVAPRVRRAGAATSRRARRVALTTAGLPRRGAAAAAERLTALVRRDAGQYVPRHRS